MWCWWISSSRSSFSVRPIRARSMRSVSQIPPLIPYHLAVICFKISGFSLSPWRSSPSKCPPRNPEGGQLTAEQKAANQALAHRLVSIEHVNRSIKRCRILKDVCRLLHNGMRDLVMEIGCALHNFRLHLDPWLPIPESE
jgi:DDE superfamily endonuclease